MKKIFNGIFFIALLVLFFTSNVFALDLEKSDGGSLWNGNYYIASGKKLDMKINASFSQIGVPSGDETVWAQKEKTSGLIVNISSSSNVSCVITNASENFNLSGDTFTVKPDRADYAYEDTLIGNISCTFPTTSGIIRLSSNSVWLNISLEETITDYAQEPVKVTSDTKSYNYKFGVVNQSYLDGLNDNKTITSVTIDDQALESSNTPIEIAKESIKVKINQSGSTGNNKIYFSVSTQNNDKNTFEVKESEKVVQIPYGYSSLTIDEYTERYLFLKGLEEVYSDIGFTDGSFDYYHVSDMGYVFHREDTRSNVNTLRSLTITDVSMTDFDKDLKTYSKTVPYKVSSVNVNALLTDEKSSFVQGFGSRKVTLEEGDNDVLIKVKAENGDEAVYTIKITREKNDDASLKTIMVDDKEIVIKKDVLKYSIKVDNDVTKPKITITPTDEKATSSFDEMEELEEGSNEISITVTASNGKEKLVYTLEIIRDSLISTNSKLKSIKIKGHELDFDSEKEEYEVHLASNEEKLDITTVTQNEKAKVVISGNKDLKNGSEIKIKVTAEDGKTVSNYVLKITKDQKKLNIVFIIVPIAVLLLGGGAFFLIKGKKKVKVSKQTENTSSNEETQVNEEKTDE